MRPFIGSQLHAFTPVLPTRIQSTAPDLVAVAHLGGRGARELAVSAGANRFARTLRQRAIKPQVVLRQETRAEHLLGVEEMTQIGARMALAHRTFARGVERSF